MRNVSRRWPVVCFSFAVLALSGWMLVVRPPLVAFLEQISFDLLQKTFPRQGGGMDVRVVDVDEESLARHGQWPWPRNRVAVLVDRLQEMGAAVIAFDMVFAEEDRNSPRVWARQWPDRPEVAQALMHLPDHDESLAAAFAAAPVVVGFTAVEGGRPGAVPQPKARVVAVGQAEPAFVPAMDGMVGNLPLLEEAASGNGSFNFRSDFDGVVRHVPLLVRHGDATYPSLAVEAVRVFEKTGNVVVEFAGPGQEAGVSQVRIGRRTVRTDANAQLWLHFAPARERVAIPAWRVLEGQVADSEVAGRILVVGTSAKGLLDLRFSPLGEMIPGVEVHAQAVEQILAGSAPRFPEHARAKSILYLCGAWLLCILLVPRLGLATAIAGGLATAILPGLAAIQAFGAHGILLDPLGPSLGAGAIFLAAIMARHFVDEREKRWIRAAFSSYVSPNLAQYLIDHPEQLSLGGEMRECSFVMTDLEGFTPFLERTEPAAVVEVLNAYLDGMVRIAFRHQGTVDRFVGDAVAVMFSAPLAQHDHAARAVACALDMGRFSQEFVARRAQEGIAFGRTRIGVHTGRVLVGNLGGGRMLDYRALGDPINTAARLEGANRHLGTMVCVSGVTAAACPGFLGRPVGVLTLAGKSEPVEAFEPLRPGEADPLILAGYGEAYARLAGGSTAAALEGFEKLLLQSPADGLIAFHVQRLRNGASGNRIALPGK